MEDEAEVVGAEDEGEEEEDEEEEGVEEEVDAFCVVVGVGIWLTNLFAVSLNSCGVRRKEEAKQQNRAGYVSARWVYNSYGCV